MLDLSNFGLPPGTLIASTYQITRLIGQGGMANVYEANVCPDRFDFAALMAHFEVLHKDRDAPGDWRYFYDRWKEKPSGVIRDIATEKNIPYPRQEKCAIKLFLPDSENARTDRFYGEWQRLITCCHPNLIEVYQGGIWRGYHYYAMELIPGLLKPERLFKLKLGQKIDVILQTASGLRAIHKSGIVHRDIKPSNIFAFFDARKKIRSKVGDLGIAKHLDWSLTVGQEIMGTPHFMSPEQSEESRKVDVRSDVYSLGATFYNLLTGVSPYQRENFHGIMLKLACGEHPTPIRKLNPAIPAFLDNIVKQMMALKPEDRFADMRQVIKALRPALQRVEKNDHKQGIPVDSTQMYIRDKKRYSHSYKNRQNKSKVLLIAGCAILIAAGILFAFKETATKKSTFSSKKTVSPCLEAMLEEYEIALASKDYRKCRAILAELERIPHQNQHFPSSGDTSEFIRIFYEQQWKKALALAPKIIEKKKAIGMLFCVRLFTCTGEYDLASWYARILYRDNPEYYQTIFHPALEINLCHFRRAYQKINSWRPKTEIGKIEKKLDEIAFNLVLYRRNPLRRSLKKSERIWQTIERDRLQFWRLYRVEKDDYVREKAKMLPARYLSVLRECPSLVQPAYRGAAIFMEQGKRSKAEKLLRPIAKRYPDFYPARIALGEFDYFSLEHAFKRHSSIKNILYSTILGYIKSGNYPKAFQGASYLVEYFPDWHFSYMYYAETAAELSKYTKSANYALKGVRIAPSILQNRALVLIDKILRSRKKGVSSCIPERMLWISQELSYSHGKVFPGQTMYLKRLLKGSSIGPFYLDNVTDARLIEKYCKKRVELKIRSSAGEFTHPYFYDLVGRSLVRLQRYHEALSYFEKASRMWNTVPDDPRRNFYIKLSVHRGYHYFSLATLYLNQGLLPDGGKKLEKAFSQFKKAMTEDPFFCRDYLFALDIQKLVDVLVERKNYSLAREVTMWGIKHLRKNTAPLWEKIFRIDELEGKLEELVKICGKRNRDSIVPGKHIKRAEALIALGEKSEARCDLLFALYLTETSKNSAQNKVDRQKAKQMLRQYFNK